jgi:hypothetical protein
LITSVTFVTHVTSVTSATCSIRKFHQSKYISTILLKAYPMVGASIEYTKISAAKFNVDGILIFIML